MVEYIERDKVYDVLNSIMSEYERSDCSYAVKDFADSVLGPVEDRIDDIPAADVRPERHGYWEKDEEGIFQCSECKRLAVPTQYSQHLGNYCPNCGAKMGGKEPESE